MTNKKNDLELIIQLLIRLNHGKIYQVDLKLDKGLILVLMFQQKVLLRKKEKRFTLLS